jgi:hypothetical protein
VDHREEERIVMCPRSPDQKASYFTGQERQGALHVIKRVGKVIFTDRIVEQLHVTFW